MTRHLVSAVLWLLAVPCLASGPPRIVLGGDVGTAAATSAARFRFAPFSSLPWLRADLTGEKVSEFDDEWGHVWHRPFKHYSGDISGRFIEIMAMDSHGDPTVHPALAGLLAEVPKLQRPGGYFCASGEIEWQQPIDYKPESGMQGWGRMLPALWGNSRLLCGLVEASTAFPDAPGIRDAATGLGDFYISMLPRFNNPDRIEEYRAAGSYAAGHVTCWFPAMEGLLKLHALTHDPRYLDASVEIAAFYQRFDELPIDHAHGMLCNQVALLMLHQVTGESAYLARVEDRWDALVEGGYVNPAGGILEKCRVRFARDEGCAIADWLRLNLELGRVTGKARYRAMAERTLHNHLLQNQMSKGGFGHRSVLCDDEGTYGFKADGHESTWCCTYHGELGFIQVRRHLLDRADGMLTCHFALDFTAIDDTGTTTSVLRPGHKDGEVLRQRLSLAGQPATVVRVRHPHWADAVSALDSGGKPLAVRESDGWCATAEPVTEVEFVYGGGVYAEDRHCHPLPDGPGGRAFVLGYGPKLLVTANPEAPVPAWPATLKTLGSFQPLSADFRGKECRFVLDRGE